MPNGVDSDQVATDLELHYPTKTILHRVGWKSSLIYTGCIGRHSYAIVKVDVTELITSLNVITISRTSATKWLHYLKKNLRSAVKGVQRKQNPSLMLSEGRKMPTRKSNVPVGNKARRAVDPKVGIFLSSLKISDQFNSHMPSIRWFGTLWRKRGVWAVSCITTSPMSCFVYSNVTDMGSILPLTKNNNNKKKNGDFSIPYAWVCEKKHLSLVWERDRKISPSRS